MSSYCRRHLLSVHKPSARRNHYLPSLRSSSMSTKKCDTPRSSESGKNTTSSSVTSQLLPSTIFPLHVLGGGSIGLLFASHIHDAHHARYGLGSCASGGEDEPNNITRPVTLLMRPHHEPRLRRKFDATPSASRRSGWFAPVTLCGTSKDGGDDEAENSHVTRSCDIPVEFLETNDNESPINCLLLCTKANDAIPALESVWDRLMLSPTSSPPANLIILSNGALAIRDAICKRFEDPQQTLNERIRIEFATTTHGAYRTQFLNDNENDVGHYIITHAGEGSTHCTNEEFFRICRSIGWSGAVLSKFDMNVMLWRKLAVNCVINPLTALYDVNNGRLLELEHGGQDIEVVMRRLLEEVSLVALMEMDSLMEEGESEKDVERLQYAREQLSTSSLQTFVVDVMTATARNISSMLQDVRARRTTEVRYLNGYVALLGQGKYGVECPWNMEMCHLVEELRH